MAENQQPQQGSQEVAPDSALAQKVAQKAHSLKFVVLAVVVAVAAAVAIVSSMRSAAAQKQAAAADQVFTSLVQLQGKSDAEIAETFAKSAKEYAGMPAGIQSAVFEFGYAFDAGNFAAAERAAADFLKNYPDSPLGPRFRLGMAKAQMRQDRPADAVETLRPLVVASSARQDVYAEAKLATAQALEKMAEAVKDNPDQYRTRLEAAQAAYNDITSQSRQPSPLQSGYWPQATVLTADFALVQIKDRLAGHELGAPVGAPEALTPEEVEALEGISLTAPVLSVQDGTPAVQVTEEARQAAAAAQAAFNALREAEQKIAAAAAVADETGSEEARNAADAAVQAVEEAVQAVEEMAAEITEVAVETAVENESAAAAAPSENAESAEDSAAFGPAARLRARAAAASGAEAENEEAAEETPQEREEEE